MSKNEQDDKIDQGYTEEPRNCCDNCTHLIMKRSHQEEKMLWCCSIGGFQVKRKKGRCTLWTEQIIN